MTLEFLHEPPTSIDGAVRFLNTLNVGDPVLVSTDSSPGRVLAMRVTVAARLADGAFGSRESTRVTVSLGVGRWSTEVVADRMVERTGLPRRFRIEPDTWQAVLDMLAAVGTREGLEQIVERFDGQPRPGGPDVTAPVIWSPEHEALARLRFGQLSELAVATPTPAPRRAVPMHAVGPRGVRNAMVRGGVL